MNDITALALLVSKAKASAFTMEYISQFEASDIDSDDVDLRFEVDGVETGTNVSIVDECGQAARMIRTLVEALEAEQHKSAKQGRHACELFDEVKQLQEQLRTVELSNSVLESRTVTVKLPELHVGVVQSGHAVMVPYPAGHWFNKTAIFEMLDAAGIQVIEGDA
ncbi:ead/Ea22-like family protein [Kluyvera cryocrescens]|uniref:ead/Ea22-like family protein n=1 Tax=Kluyvera cryocrescens TaxID=580 RepID=UPI000D8AAA1C|nr:ead/Ea22-like family protein [Kluyvera cryocrescens]SQC33621.1 Uncharacterised protein [Kluyvera cryocrescens]